MQAAAAAAADVENLSTIKAKAAVTGRAIAVNNQDPMATIKAQLGQQDAKLEQLTGVQPSYLYEPWSTEISAVVVQIQHKCKKSWIF